MPHMHKIERLNDSELMVLAQDGDAVAAAHLAHRFGGIDNGKVGAVRSGLVGGTAVRVCKRVGRVDDESIGEVAARIYLAIFDPTKRRFDPTRCKSPAPYIYGLGLNAVKSFKPTHSLSDFGHLETKPNHLSAEDQDCVCWVFRSAPPTVRKAFARLRGGRTLQEAAIAVGKSRRSLKRAIDEHLDASRRILTQPG